MKKTSLTEKLSKKLTGIERDLVLRYLIDGNVPVSVVSLDAVHSEVFSIDFNSRDLKILEQGIILLDENSASHHEKVYTYFENLAGKTVRVLFYFNGLGLFFDTVLKSVSTGLALVVPKEISRIEDECTVDTSSFKVVFYYSPSEKSINLECTQEQGFNAIFQPKWSVAVCRYLSAPSEKKMESVQGRKKVPTVLFIDNERIVFGMEGENTIFHEGSDYALKISFPLGTDGPIKTRDIYVTCMLEKTFSSRTGEKSCCIFRFTTIKNEDTRFLFERTKNKLLQ